MSLLILKLTNANVDKLFPNWIAPWLIVAVGIQLHPHAKHNNAQALWINIVAQWCQIAIGIFRLLPIPSLVHAQKFQVVPISILIHHIHTLVHSKTYSALNPLILP